MSGITTNIQDIIPQRPPFVFVDTLLEMAEERSRVQFTVPADCPLAAGGCLTAAGLLEHTAQACAARIGYLQAQAGQPIRIGYIGSVKEMTIARRPQTGETITTEIVLLESVFDISLFRCVCRVGETVAAEVTLKLALV